MSNIPTPYLPSRPQQPSPYLPPQFNAPPPMHGPAGPMPIGKVLFSFEGRIPRRTWWLWKIISALPLIFFLIVLGAVSPNEGHSVQSSEASPPVEVSHSNENGEGTESRTYVRRSEPPLISSVLFLALLVVAIPVIWINLALSIKRWHDRGKSGTWILINFVPSIGGLWALIECGFLSGTPGHNLYGPDPG